MTFDPTNAFIDCPKCDSARHVERVKGEEWFCNCCSHTFEVPSTEAGTTRRNPAAAGSSRAALQFAVLLVSLLLPAMGNAQTDPRTLPRVAESDVEYVGSFLAPFAWGGRPLSLADGGKSLWYGCPGGAQVAKITIPAMDATAATVAPCQGIPNMSAVSPGDPNGYRFGGLLETDGRLLATAYPTYDASAAQRFTHFAGTSLASMAGPYRVGADLPGRIAGTMTEIPAEWRGLFGGSHLTGLCCVSIVGRTSLGPSAYVFNPDQVGTASPVPATPVLMYPIEHPLGRPYTAPGEAEGVIGKADPYYSALTMYPGAAWPRGTRSVLFVGRHADTICYGSPNACGGDPTSADKGNHGYPYYYVLAAYDAVDLLAVKQGTKQPWEPRPYGFWKIPGSRPDVTINGAAFDPNTNRLYVSEENNRRVHVWHIKTGGVVTPPPPPPPTPVNCSGVWSETLSEPTPLACDATRVQTRTRTRTFTVVTQPTPGGNACPASPVVTQETSACEFTPPPPPPAPTVSGRVRAQSLVTAGLRLTLDVPDATPLPAIGATMQVQVAGTAYTATVFDIDRAYYSGSPRSTRLILTVPGLSYVSVVVVLP